MSVALEGHDSVTDTDCKNMVQKKIPLDLDLLQVPAKRLDTPELQAGHVDVWHLWLDDRSPEESVPPALASARIVLASDELARAARFHFEQDRVRFIRCRAALRRLLGDYLNLAPAEVRFTYSPHSKPEVAADQNPNRLRFNVSHSGGMAVIAVGGPEDLGVDVEKIREDVNTADLAERFFSTREREMLRALPQSQRLPAFYACWACKEAFLKAIGDGLGFPLADFSVSVHPESAPRIEEIQGDANAGLEWSLIDLNVADGFRSALAIKRQGISIATYRFSD